MVPPTGEVVVVVGAEGPVATALVDRLRHDGQVGPILAVGTPEDHAASNRSRVDEQPVGSLRWLPAEQAKNLDGVLDGVDCVIHLGAPSRVASGAPRPLDGTGNRADVMVARAVLEACATAGVEQVVLLSSAMAYGAWANNPVPLTEDAPLRPDPQVAYAIAIGEIERLALEWREANPSSILTVLRPTVTVTPTSDGASRWLERSPWAPLRWRSGDLGPPVQFLLANDLVEAIDLARRLRLDGAFNVAPAGWIPPEVLPGLAGPLPQVQVPTVLADALSRTRLSWRGYPPAVSAYVSRPWVVASDRLRAAGWTPSDTNEEAFVEAFEGGPFAAMDARRRQILSMAAVGVGLAALASLAVALVRRRLHRP